MTVIPETELDLFFTLEKKKKHITFAQKGEIKCELFALYV